MANTFLNKKVDLTTTSVTTLYTVPTATTSIIKSIRVSNTDTENDCNISLFLVDSGGSSFGIETDRTVKAKRSAELLATGVLNAGFGSVDSSFAPATAIVVKESEIIKAQAQNGNDLNIIISVLEMSST